MSCILIPGQLGGELANALGFLHNISEKKKFIYIPHCNTSRVVSEAAVQRKTTVSRNGSQSYGHCHRQPHRTATHHEWRSLIGYATHYLFCDR